MALPDPTETPARHRRASLAALIAVLLFALWLDRGSVHSWFFDDDFRNIRWALEYRNEPWLALTELHAVHDHIRPAALVAYWLGLAVGAGKWIGPHVVLRLLQLLAVVTVALLARQRTRSWAAAPVAALLALSIPGVHVLTAWNSWIGSAGETAFGLLALVLVHQGLRRGAWLVPAAVALALAGLFKEPGWVIYPAGVLALCVAAWRDGLRGPRLWGAASLAAIGPLGFWLTWHPANALRSSLVDRPLALRLQVFLGEDLGTTIDLLSSLDLDLDGRGGLGVVAPLVFGLLLLGLLPRDTLKRPRLVLAALGAIALASGIAWANAVAAGAILLTLAIATLARDPLRPSLGLVVCLASFGVMAPFGKADPAQVTAAGLGLVLHIVEVAWRLELPDRTRRRAVLAVASALVLATAVRTAGSMAEVGPRDLSLEREGREFEATGAVLQALEVQEAWAEERQEQWRLASLMGVSVSEERMSWHPEVTVAGDLLLPAPTPERLAELLGHDILDGATLPTDRRAAGVRRPRPGESAPDLSLAWTETAHEVQVDSGYHMLLVRIETPLEDGQTLIGAVDGCGRIWQLATAQTATPLIVQPLHVDRGCSPLRLSWAGPRMGEVFLIPLASPRMGLWEMPWIPRTLDIAPQVEGLAPLDPLQAGPPPRKEQPDREEGAPPQPPPDPGHHAEKLSPEALAEQGEHPPPKRPPPADGTLEPWRPLPGGGHGGAEPAEPFRAAVPPPPPKPGQR